MRVKDLPACGQRTQVWWRKRRLACTEAGLPGGLVHADQYRDPAAGPGLGPVA